MSLNQISGLSLPDLFDRVMAAGDAEDVAAWDAIWRLRYIGSVEVLEHAVAMTQDVAPRLRSRGAAILGQLGIPDRTFPDACFYAIARLTTDREDIEVLKSAISALGHLGDARGVGIVARYAGHADADVRLSVAVALGGRRETIATETLVALTRDSDDDVRDWATFGIGEIGESDTPAIRRALFDRLQDRHEDTRFEAICGLARCRDPWVLPLLVEALKEDRADDSLERHAKAWLNIDEDQDFETETLIAKLEGLRHDRLR